MAVGKGDVTNVVSITPLVRRQLAGSAAGTVRFTERYLSGLPLSVIRYEVADAALPFLICRVGARDRTLYVRRKMRGAGKLVYHRLGIVGEKPLGEYRLDAERVAAELSAGKAPGSDLSRRGGITLGQAFRDYLEARRLRPGSVLIYRDDYARTWAQWARRPVASITPAEVLARHRERSKASPARADGALRLLRAVFCFTARVHGLALPNPVDHVSAADAWNRVPRRNTVIPVDMISAWTKAVLELPDDSGPGITGRVRDALLLLMVLALRHEEGLHLPWSEVDLERGRIAIAADRMKAGKAHELPIPRRAIEMLRKRRVASTGSYVFPGLGGDKPLHVISRRYLDPIGAAIGVHFMVHDLRRTAATWFGTHAPAFIVRRILAHADASVTDGYVRIDTEALRSWLQQWEEVVYG